MAPFSSSVKYQNPSKKSPLSKSEKHTNLEVTACLHFDTTNTNFAYIES
jgi:hypothetical protein